MGIGLSRSYTFLSGHIYILSTIDLYKHIFEFAYIALALCFSNALKFRRVVLFWLLTSPSRLIGVPLYISGTAYILSTIDLYKHIFEFA